MCQYRDASVEFSGNTIAVIGPNGSGKSNLLSAVYASLTNDWSRLPGGKSANVRYGSKGPAHSVVEFSHDGTECQLVRDLKGKSSCLLVGDGERVTGEDAITSRIFDILKVKDHRVLNDYVFIAQSVSHAFLESTENKRHKAMQHLFDLAKFEKIAELVKDETKKFVPRSVDAELAELQLELTSMNRRRLSLTSELDKYPAKDISNSMQTIDAWNRQQSQKRNIEETEKRKRTCRSNIKDIDSRILKAENDLKELDAYVSAHEEAYRNQRAAEDANNRRAEALKDIDKLDQSIADIRKQIRAASAIKPKEPLQQLVPAVEEVGGRLVQIRSALALIAHREVECPTCGTPVKNFNKEELQRQSVELSDRQSKLRKQIETLQALNNLNNLLEAEESRKASLLKFVPDMQAEVMSSEQQQEFKAKLKQQKQVELELASFRGARAAEVKQLKLLESATVATVGDTVSEEDYEAARSDIDSHRELNDTRQKLLTDIAVIQSQLSAGSKKLSQLKEDKQKIEKEKDWFDRCCQVADVFRDLPKIITQHHLHTIEQRMAPIIAAFDATFRVAASDGLELVAVFDDGSQQPCSRLSGGQKDVLGLAYYFAVNLLYAASVRLVVMDEPTRFMDDSYVSKMLDVLAGMKDVVAKYDVQCVVVTHEKRLATVFDQVIDVGELT